MTRAMLVIFLAVFSNHTVLAAMSPSIPGAVKKNTADYGEAPKGFVCEIAPNVQCSTIQRQAIWERRFGDLCVKLSALNRWEADITERIKILEADADKVNKAEKRRRINEMKKIFEERDLFGRQRREVVGELRDRTSLDLAEVCGLKR